MGHELGKGTYLIANPHGNDPNFTETVVLICDHNKYGTFGLILNKSLNTTEAQILTIKHKASGNKNVFSGGPVDTNKLFCLHGNLKNNSCNCEHICDGVYLVSGNDCLNNLLSDNSTNTPFRFYLGCAGWSPGQLENEIKMNFWTIGPANENIVFYQEPDKIWWYILRFISGYDPGSPFNPSQPVLN